MIGPFALRDLLLVYVGGMLGYLALYCQWWVYGLRPQLREEYARIISPVRLGVISTVFWPLSALVTALAAPASLYFGWYDTSAQETIREAEEAAGDDDEEVRRDAG